MLSLSATKASAAAAATRGSSSSSKPAALPSPSRPVPRLASMGCQRRAPAGAELPPAVCRGVKFNAEMSALLSDALARSSDRITERIGVPGLRLEQSLCTEQLTGQVVWEAGIQLACHLRDLHATGKQDMTGLRVLELGSGLGVVGLTAALLGASVTLTDMAAALHLTQSNVQANEAAVRSAGGQVQVAELNWDSPPAQLLEGPWDMCIGADLVFEDHSPEVLAAVFDGLLRSNPGLTILMSHHHRSDALDELMGREFANRGLEIRTARRLTSSPYEAEASLLQVARSG